MSLKSVISKVLPVFVFIVFNIVSHNLNTPVLAAGNTYYVSTTGSDTNTGTQASPWKTISKATSTVNAGDTVYFIGGIYKEQFTISKSGTATARISFLAAPNEVPVIDASGMSSITYDGLVQIRDGVNYITFSGFTVKGSPNMGIANRGSNNIISDNKVLLSYDTAIWHRFGTNTVYRNNEVFLNERSNSSSASEADIVCQNNTTGWPAALNSQRVAGTSSIWEGNYVHDNCGEGIVANIGDKIIGNTFKDNWSVNIYIDEATDVIVDRNFVYETNTTYIPRGSDNSYKNIASGLYVSDETACLARNNTFTNNIIVNARYGFGFYQYSSCSGLINTKILGNTFVNSWDYGLRIAGSSALNSGSLVANNIVSTKQGKSLVIDNPLDTQFLNNLWYFSGGNSTGQFQWGVNTYDFTNWNKLSSKIIGNLWIDPQFSGVIPTDSNQYISSLFTLRDTSPAINVGLLLPQLKSDFLGIARPYGAGYDIGAYEYVGSGQVDLPTPITAKQGDSNGDGLVNEVDYGAWKDTYLGNTACAIATCGDFDNSGKVDGVDYVVWVINFGK